MISIIHAVEVKTTLNAPEGYLVQARSGTDDSSEIIGTFLSYSTVIARNSSVLPNFKVLECSRSMSEIESGDVFPVSIGYSLCCII